LGRAVALSIFRVGTRRQAVQPWRRKECRWIFPNKYPEKRQRGYPFSDKASLISRELLKDPKRQRGIRELAEKIGLGTAFDKPRHTEVGYT